MMMTFLPFACSGGRPVVVGHRVALLNAVGPRQELHRLMDAVELATGDRQIAPGGGAAGQHNRVELGAQLLRR